MEEEVLGSQSTDEPVTNVTTGTRVGIEWHEAREGLTILHPRHTPSLKLLLAEKSGDLSLIDDTAFRTSLHHSRDKILREALNKTGWDTVLQNL